MYKKLAWICGMSVIFFGYQSYVLSSHLSVVQSETTQHLSQSFKDSLWEFPVLVSIASDLLLLLETVVNNTVSQRTLKVYLGRLSKSTIINTN
jgi:hypothetical protein